MASPTSAESHITESSHAIVHVQFVTVKVVHDAGPRGSRARRGVSNAPLHGKELNCKASIEIRVGLLGRATRFFHFQKALSSEGK